jgi:polysaccharide biosynthesis protein VpsM
MKLIAIITTTMITSIPSVFAEKFEPAAFSNYFTPTIETMLEYDDNIYTTEFQTESSYKFYLMPAIKFNFEDGVNRYGAEYTLTSISYSDGVSKNDADDDALDHNFLLYADNEFTAKHRTSINLSYDKLHEDRGSGLTESDPFEFAKPITYDLFKTRLYYQFGGRNAKMRLGGGFAYRDKDFTKFEKSTKYSSYDGQKLFFDIDYQLGDITYLTFDISTEEISFKNLKSGDISSDNTDNRALLGVSWRGASKLKGNAKVGYQSKRYDVGAINRDNFSGGNLDIGIKWSPLQRSIFSFDINSAAEDTNNPTDGNYIIKIAGTVGWFHSWTNKIDSNIYLGYGNDEYFGTDREDKISNIGFDVSYGFTRWLNMSAGYDYTSTDSDAPNISNDQSILFVSLRVGL